MKLNEDIDNPFGDHRRPLHFGLPMCGNHMEMWLAVGIIYCGLLGLGFCWALEAALQGLGG